MCLAIYKDTKFEISKEDLIVYKIILTSWDSDTVISEYTRFKYVKDHLNLTTISFEEDNYNQVPLDSRERYIIETLFNTNLENIKDQNLVRWIKTGFHFMFNENRAINLIDDWNVYLGEFLIPKGSIIYRGIDSDLGVTTRIIFKNIVL